MTRAEVVAGLVGIVGFAVGWIVRNAGARMEEADLHDLVIRYRDKNHGPCTRSLEWAHAERRWAMEANRDLRRHIVALEEVLDVRSGEDLDDEIRHLTEGGGS